MVECIACSKNRIEEFLNLGETALANKFLSKEDLNIPEPVYPLIVGTCLDCGHVQLTHHVPPQDMFDDYLYISSLSKTLVDHFHGLATTVVERCRLGDGDLVVDIGCNDGTLLAKFKKHGVRVMGVDPAANLAPLAKENGVHTLIAYFDEESAAEIVARHGQASAVTATNVFPHVPDFSGFLRGLDRLLKPGGSFVIEAHYLAELIAQCAFDTVYHEHVSYWALSPAQTLFNRFGFEIVGITQMPIHHGQIRLFVQRIGEGAPVASVAELLEEEKRTELTALGNLRKFTERIEQNRGTLHETLVRLNGENKKVVGYGAPAKGNTLLTYLGIDSALIPYISDKSPLKQGLFTPGTHIPIVPPERLLAEQPDYVLILAWNFADEIMAELSEHRSNGGLFIIPVPEVRII